MPDVVFAPVDNPGVFRPDDEAVRAYMQDHDGFVHIDDLLEATPLTDAEVIGKARAGTSWEIGSTGATTPIGAKLRLDGEHGAYFFDLDESRWGMVPLHGDEDRPGPVTRTNTYQELMALAEIYHRQSPRMLGSLMMAQSARLGLNTPAEPRDEPEMLTKWTVQGRDSETGQLRVDGLNRDSYNRFFGHQYPIPPKSR